MQATTSRVPMTKRGGEPHSSLRRCPTGGDLSHCRLHGLDPHEPMTPAVDLRFASVRRCFQLRMPASRRSLSASIRKRDHSLASTLRSMRPFTVALQMTSRRASRFATDSLVVTSRELPGSSPR